MTESFQFLWWIGVVEDRKDPLKLGRCRVRIFGHHSEKKTEVPTNKLPWAHPVLPLNNSNPYAPKEGETVVGFYMDGEDRQFPVMMGITPGIPIKRENDTFGFTDPRSSSELASAPSKPDIFGESKERYPRTLDEPTTPRAARNESTDKSQHQDKLNKLIESKSDYDLVEVPKTVYPYNNVYESESGHLMEFDDTPGAERVHLYHRSGTYQEFFSNGDAAQKVENDKREVVRNNYKLYVGKDGDILVVGDAKIRVGGNCELSVGKKLTISAQSIDISSESTIGVQAPGGIIVTEGNMTIAGAFVSEVGVIGTISSPSGESLEAMSGMITSIG